MRHAAITIEGVLRDPLNGHPHEDGRILYQAIATHYRITLLADTEITDVLTEWLRVEGYTSHTKIVAPAHHPDPRQRRLQQIRGLRAIGAVDLCITSDPALVGDLYTMGQPHLPYIAPRHLAHLPARETWDQLTGRIDADRRLAAQRMNEDQ